MHYSKDYFHNIKLKTRWAPNKEFYEKIMDLCISISMSDSGWYNIDRKTSSFKGELNKEQFYFIWNNYPNKDIRGGLIDLAFSGDTRRRAERLNSKSTLNEYKDEFLALLYSNIPINFDMESNKLRATFAQKMFKDFDYLSEVTKAKLVNKDGIATLWSKAGLSCSKDNSLYEYLWSTVKREKGSVERRMEIIRCSTSNGVISEKIFKHCASRGTKRVKRIAVERLSDSLYNARRRDDDELSSSIVELLLLFATTDDSNVVDCLSECLSVNNLPWVMPSASNFPWLLRRINTRIERSRQ